MRQTQSPRDRDERVPRARRLRREVTDAERKLWWHLRRLPIEGTHFRRQATIGPFFVDFACHDHRLVIELDGGQHNEAEQIADDMLRTKYMNARGYRVLRFWNNEVNENIEGVLNCIHAAVSESIKQPPTPDPSPPQAGGGEKNFTPARSARRPSPSRGG